MDALPQDIHGRGHGTNSLAPDKSLHEQQKKLKDVLDKFTAHAIFQSDPPVRVAYCERTRQFEKLMDVAVPPFLANFPTTFGAWDKELTQFSESLLDLFSRGSIRLDGLFVSDTHRERTWVVQLIAFIRHMNTWDRRNISVEEGAPTPTQLGKRAIDVASNLLVALGVETLEGQKGPEPWQRFRNILNELIGCCRGESPSRSYDVCANYIWQIYSVLLLDRSPSGLTC